MQGLKKRCCDRRSDMIVNFCTKYISLRNQIRSTCARSMLPQNDLNSSGNWDKNIYVNKFPIRRVVTKENEQLV